MIIILKSLYKCSWEQSRIQSFSLLRGRLIQSGMMMIITMLLTRQVHG
jgi:hypothetical protein